MIAHRSVAGLIAFVFGLVTIGNVQASELGSNGWMSVDKFVETHLGPDDQTSPEEFEELLQMTIHVDVLKSILDPGRRGKVIGDIPVPEFNEAILEHWLEIERTRIVSKIVEDAVRFSLVSKSDLNETIVDSAKGRGKQVERLATRQNAAKSLFMLATYSRVLANLQSRALRACQKETDGLTEKKLEEALNKPWTHLKEGDWITRWEEFVKDDKPDNGKFQRFLWTQLFAEKFEEGELSKDAPPSFHNEAQIVFGETGMLPAVKEAAGIILTQPGFNDLSAILRSYNANNTLVDNTDRILRAGGWFIATTHGAQRTSWLKKANLSAKATEHLIDFVCSVVPANNSPRTSIASDVDELIEERIKRLTTEPAELGAWLKKNHRLYAASRAFRNLKTDVDIEAFMNKQGYERVTAINDFVFAPDRDLFKDLPKSAIRNLKNVKKRLVQQIHEQCFVDEMVKGKGSLGKRLGDIRLLREENIARPKHGEKREKDTGRYSYLDLIHRGLVARRHRFFDLLEENGITNFSPGEAAPNFASKLRPVVSEWQEAMGKLRVATEPAGWLASQLNGGSNRSIQLGRTGIYVSIAEIILDERAVEVRMTAELKFPRPDRFQEVLRLVDANTAIPDCVVRLTIPDTIDKKTSLKQLMETAVSGTTPELTRLIQNYVNDNSAAVLTKLQEFLPGLGDIEAGTTLNASLTGDAVVISANGVELALRFGQQIDQVEVLNFAANLLTAKEQELIKQILKKAVDTGSSSLENLVGSFDSNQLLPYCKFDAEKKHVTLALRDVIREFGIRCSLSGRLTVTNDGIECDKEDWETELANVLISKAPILMQDSGARAWTFPVTPDSKLRLTLDGTPSIEVGKVVVTFAVQSEPGLAGGWSVKPSNGDSTVKLAVSINDGKESGIQSAGTARKLSFEFHGEGLDVMGPDLIGDLGTNLSFTKTDNELSFEGNFDTFSAYLRPTAAVLGIDLPSEQTIRSVVLNSSGGIEIDGQAVSSTNLSEAILRAAVDRTPLDKFEQFLVHCTGAESSNLKTSGFSGTLGDFQINAKPTSQPQRITTKVLTDLNDDGNRTPLFDIDFAQADVPIQITPDGEEFIRQKINSQVAKIFDDSRLKADEIKILESAVTARNLSIRISIAVAGLEGKDPVSLTAMIRVALNAADGTKLDVTAEVDAPDVKFLAKVTRNRLISIFLSRLYNANATKSEAERNLRVEPNGRDSVLVYFRHTKQPVFQIVGVRIGKPDEDSPVDLVRIAEEIEISAKEGWYDILVDRFKVPLSQLPDVQISNEGQLLFTFRKGAEAFRLKLNLADNADPIEVDPTSAASLRRIAASYIEKEALKLAEKAGRDVAEKAVESIDTYVKTTLKDLRKRVSEKLKNPIVKVENFKAYPNILDPRGAYFDLIFNTKESIGSEIRLNRIFVSKDASKLDFAESTLKIVPGLDQVEAKLLDSIAPLCGKGDGPIRVADFKLQTSLPPDFLKREIPIGQLETVLGNLLLIADISIEADLSKIPLLNSVDALANATPLTVLIKIPIHVSTGKVEVEGGDVGNALLCKLFEEVKKELEHTIADGLPMEALKAILTFTTGPVDCESGDGPSLTVQLHAKPDVEGSEFAALAPTLTCDVVISAHKLDIGDVKLVTPDPKAITDKLKKKIMEEVLGPFSQFLSSATQGTLAINNAATLSKGNFNGTELKGVICDVKLPKLGTLALGSIMLRVTPAGKVKLLSSPRIVIPIESPVKPWTYPASFFGLNFTGIAIDLPQGDPKTVGITAMVDAGVYALPPETIKVSGELTVKIGGKNAIEVSGRGFLFEYVDVGYASAEAVIKSVEKKELPGEKGTYMVAPYASAKLDIGGMLSSIILVRGDFFAGNVKGKTKGLLVLGKQNVKIFNQDAQNIMLRISKDGVQFSEKTNLFIARFEYEFDMSSPSNATLAGSGSVGFKQWQLANARIGVDPRYGNLKARVVGLPLRMSFPGPASITPGRVEKRILELLWLDPMKLLQALRNIRLGEFRLNVAGGLSWASSSSDGSMGEPSSGNPGHGPGDGDPSSGDTESYAEYSPLLPESKSGGDPTDWTPESLTPAGSNGTDKFSWKFEDNGAPAGHVTFSQSTSGQHAIKLGVLSKAVGGQEMFQGSGNCVPTGIFIGHGQLAHIPYFVAEEDASWKSDIYTEYGIEESWETLSEGEAEAANQKLNPRVYSQVIKTDDGKPHLYTMLNSLVDGNVAGYSDFWGQLPISKFGIELETLAKSRQSSHAYIRELLNAISFSMAERLTWAHVRENFKKIDDDQSLPQIGKGHDLIERDSVRSLLVDKFPEWNPNADPVVALAFRYKDDFFTTLFVCGLGEEGKAETRRTLVVRMADFDGFLSLSRVQQEAELRTLVRTADTDNEGVVSRPRFPAPMYFINGAPTDGSGGLFALAIPSAAGSTGAGGSKDKANAAESQRKAAIENANVNSTLMKPAGGGGASGFLKGKGGGPEYWKISMPGGTRPPGFKGNRPVIGRWVKKQGDWKPGGSLIDPFVDSKIASVKTYNGLGTNPSRIVVAADGSSPGSTKKGAAFVNWPSESGQRNPRQYDLTMNWPEGTVPSQFGNDFPGFYARFSNWFAFVRAAQITRPSQLQLSSWDPAKIPQGAVSIQASTVPFTSLLRTEKLQAWKMQLYQGAASFEPHPVHLFFFSLPEDFDPAKDTVGRRRFGYEEFSARGSDLGTHLPRILRHRSVQNLDHKLRREKTRIRVLPGNDTLCIGASSPSDDAKLFLSSYTDTEYVSVPFDLDAFSLEPATRRKEGEDGTFEPWFYGTKDNTFSKAFLKLVNDANVTDKPSSIATFRVSTEGEADDILGMVVSKDNEHQLKVIDDNASSTVGKIHVEAVDILLRNESHVGAVIEFLLQNDTDTDTGKRTWKFLDVAPQSDDPSKEKSTWFRAVNEPAIYGTVRTKQGVRVRQFGTVDAALIDDSLNGNFNVASFAKKFAFETWWLELASSVPVSGGPKELFRLVSANDNAYVAEFTRPSTFSKEWGTELRWIAREWAKDDETPRMIVLPLEFDFGTPNGFMTWDNSESSKELIKAVQEDLLADDQKVQALANATDRKSNETIEAHLFPRFNGPKLESLAAFVPDKSAVGTVHWLKSKPGERPGIIRSIQRVGADAFRHVLRIADSSFEVKEWVARSTSNAASPDFVRTDRKVIAAHVLMPKLNASPGWNGATCWQSDQANRAPRDGQLRFWIDTYEDTPKDADWDSAGAIATSALNRAGRINVLGSKIIKAFQTSRSELYLATPSDRNRIWVAKEGAEPVAGARLDGVLYNFDLAASPSTNAALEIPDEDNIPELTSLAGLPKYLSIFDRLESWNAAAKTAGVVSENTISLVTPTSSQEKEKSVWMAQSSFTIQDRNVSVFIAVPREAMREEGGGEDQPATTESGVTSTVSDSSTLQWVYVSTPDAALSDDELSSLRGPLSARSKENPLFGNLFTTVNKNSRSYIFSRGLSSQLLRLSESKSNLSYLGELPQPPNVGVSVPLLRDDPQFFFQSFDKITAFWLPPHLTALLDRAPPLFKEGDSWFDLASFAQSTHDTQSDSAQPFPADDSEWIGLFGLSWRDENDTANEDADPVLRIYWGPKDANSVQIVGRYVQSDVLRGLIRDEKWIAGVTSLAGSKIYPLPKPQVEVPGASEDGTHAHYVAVELNGVVRFKQLVGTEWKDVSNDYTLQQVGSWETRASIGRLLAQLLHQAGATADSPIMIESVAVGSPTATDDRELSIEQAALRSAGLSSMAWGTTKAVDTQISTRFVVAERTGSSTVLSFELVDLEHDSDANSWSRSDAQDKVDPRTVAQAVRLTTGQPLGSQAAETRKSLDVYVVGSAQQRFIASRNNLWAVSGSLPDGQAFEFMQRPNSLQLSFSDSTTPPNFALSDDDSLVLNSIDELQLTPSFLNPVAFTALSSASQSGATTVWMAKDGGVVDSVYFVGGESDIEVIKRADSLQAIGVSDEAAFTFRFGQEEGLRDKYKLGFVDRLIEIQLARYLATGHQSWNSEAEEGSEQVFSVGPLQSNRGTSRILVHANNAFLYRFANNTGSVHLLQKAQPDLEKLLPAQALLDSKLAIKFPAEEPLLLAVHHYDKDSSRAFYRISADAVKTPLNGVKGITYIDLIAGVRSRTPDYAMLLQSGEKPSFENEVYDRFCEFILKKDKKNRSFRVLAEASGRAAVVRGDNDLLLYEDGRWEQSAEVPAEVFSGNKEVRSLLEKVLSTDARVHVDREETIRYQSAGAKTQWLWLEWQQKGDSINEKEMSKTIAIRAAGKADIDVWSPFRVPSALVKVHFRDQDWKNFVVNTADAFTAFGKDPIVHTRLDISHAFVRSDSADTVMVYNLNGGKTFLPLPYEVKRMTEDVANMDLYGRAFWDKEKPRRVPIEDYEKGVLRVGIVAGAMVVVVSGMKPNDVDKESIWWAVDPVTTTDSVFRWGTCSVAEVMAVWKREDLGTLPTEMTGPLIWGAIETQLSPNKTPISLKIRGRMIRPNPSPFKALLNAKEVVAPAR